MSERDEHPRKEIRKALKEAEAQGWEIERRHGHAWGVARCSSGCKISIFTTPANDVNHANQIRRAIKKCPHRQETEQ